MFLACVDQGLQHFALWREPEAVVDQFRIAWHDAVFQVHSAAIERDAFNGAVGGEQNGAAWRFINTARLHSHKAVFHQVQAANAVALAKGVEFGKHFRRRQAHAVDANGIAALKLNGDIFWLVRGVERAICARINKLWRFIGRVFQHLAFG